ncbi:YjzD family protein [Heyndrickxia acidicola]|uniref:YjzD family protein n=1 Tax=Heyndrickxia acidicola TaxID=209389 RepID=A0ABU6MCV9_9BACI|nr:YjzD family protein [Heyndrickxia acidicola]MED1202501.1 YjzD family protein [Heyndrickxia acidicola]
MKYVFTLIWTFLLVQMLFYVTSSMTNTGYSFQTATILSVIFTILIIAVSSSIPKASNEH